MRQHRILEIRYFWLLTDLFNQKSCEQCKCFNHSNISLFRNMKVSYLYFVQSTKYYSMQKQQAACGRHYRKQSCDTFPKIKTHVIAICQLNQKYSFTKRQLFLFFPPFFHIIALQVTAIIFLQRFWHYNFLIFFQHCKSNVTKMS